MLQVSDAYKELVKSNIRPKCEPIIKVSGVDNNGDNVELIWRASNIKDLKYKRGVDPVGRELPYMELTWTEIYTGKLNAVGYPQKYNNVTSYMQVELSFVQDLDFYSTWKTILNGGLKWSDLLTKTWKRVKKEVSQETITVPKLFLSAKPTIDGKTITWVAKDFFSFLNVRQSRKFKGIPFKNAISYFVLNGRAGVLNSPNMIKSCTDTAKVLLDRNDVEEIIDKTILCDANINQILLNLASVYTYYFDFKENIAILNKFKPFDSVFEFNGNILYDYPKIESIPSVSSYSFKYGKIQTDLKNAYYKTPYQISNFGLGNNVLYYELDGLGDAYRSYDEEFTFVLNPDELNKAILWQRADPTTDPWTVAIYVVPNNYESYDDTINFRNSNGAMLGEPLTEDNPINPYDKESSVIKERAEFIKKYFSNSLSNIEFEALPNLAIETNDVITVETNLYDDYGKNIFKNALVVSMELNYNGTLKQRIKAHEVVI